MYNFLINSCKEWSQENGSSLITLAAQTSGFAVKWLLDQWECDYRGTFTATAQQVDDAPDGYQKSLKFTTVVPQSSLGADDLLSYFQPLMGERIARLGLGTSAAQDIAIGFWVKSNRTGQHGGTFKKSGVIDGRVYAFAYDIDEADTWEFKSLVIPGDTGGTWATDNSRAAFLLLNVASGSNYQVTPGEWGTQNAANATGSINGVANEGDYIQFGPVVATAGSEALSPEDVRDLVRNKTEELALCQQYFQRHTQPPLRGFFYSFSGGVGIAGRLAMLLAVRMRSSPQVRVGGELLLTDGNGLNFGHTSPSGVGGSHIQANYSTSEAVEFNAYFTNDAGSTLGVGKTCFVSQDGNSSHYLDLDARLP